MKVCENRVSEIDFTRTPILRDLLEGGFRSRPFHDVPDGRSKGRCRAWGLPGHALVHDDNLGQLSMAAMARQTVAAVFLKGAPPFRPPARALASPGLCPRRGCHPFRPGGLPVVLPGPFLVRGLKGTLGSRVVTGLGDQGLRRQVHQVWLPDLTSGILRGDGDGAALGTLMVAATAPLPFWTVQRSRPSFKSTGSSPLNHLSAMTCRLPGFQAAPLGWCPSTARVVAIRRPPMPARRIPRMLISTGCSTGCELRCMPSSARM